MTKLVLQLFCLLHFCHLASCWHVHIARLFVCDFACSFAFLHWICHCLLALFFAIVLFIAWLLFLCQIAHICIFCFSAGFCISNLLVLGGFLSLYVHFFCVLNLPYVYDHADLIALHCYCCCYCFFGSFRVFVFLHGKCNVLHDLCWLILTLLSFYFVDMCATILAYAHNIPKPRNFATISPSMILPGHHDHPWWHSAFFGRCYSL